MEPDGVGALYQELEERKEKLLKEGLFQGPKQTLPRFPKRIAVLTSPSGAVIRDIITTVKRRYPIVQLVLFPTVVQGNQAADNIVKNIQQVEKLGNFDTMIIGRGGGSMKIYGHLMKSELLEQSMKQKHLSYPPLDMRQIQQLLT